MMSTQSPVLFKAPNGRTFRSTGQRRAVQVGDWHLCHPLLGPLKVEYLAPDEVHICTIWEEVPREDTNGHPHQA